MFCGLVLVFLFAILSARNTEAKKHFIQWDSSLTPVLLSGEYHLEVEVDDWMDVLCPHKATGANHERFIQLYNVTREQFRRCHVTKKQRILDCRFPEQETKLTTKFQRRSPTPYGFVYQPGESYYYISKPSSGGSIGCDKNTMRMVITVCDENRNSCRHKKKPYLSEWDTLEHFQNPGQRKGKNGKSDFESRRKSPFHPEIKRLKPAVAASRDNKGPNGSGLRTSPSWPLCIFLASLLGALVVVLE